MGGWLLSYLSGLTGLELLSFLLLPSPHYSALLCAEFFLFLVLLFFPLPRPSLQIPFQVSFILLFFLNPSLLLLTKSWSTFKTKTPCPVRSTSYLLSIPSPLSLLSPFPFLATSLSSSSSPSLQPVYPRSPVLSATTTLPLP